MQSLTKFTKSLGSKNLLLKESSKNDSAKPVRPQIESSNTIHMSSLAHQASNSSLDNSIKKFYKKEISQTGTHKVQSRQPMMKTPNQKILENMRSRSKTDSIIEIHKMEPGGELYFKKPLKAQISVPDKTISAMRSDQSREKSSSVKSRGNIHSNQKPGDPAKNNSTISAISEKYSAENIDESIEGKSNISFSINKLHTSDSIVYRRMNEMKKRNLTAGIDDRVKNMQGLFNDNPSQTKVQSEELYQDSGFDGEKMLGDALFRIEDDEENSSFTK